jgi:hypothetical protein
MKETSPLFLEEHEVDTLSGIARGRTENRGQRHERKLSKYELQVQHLRLSGLPFYINARGRPILTRAAVEGRKAEPLSTGWQPKVMAA